MRVDDPLGRVAVLVCILASAVVNVTWAVCPDVKVREDGPCETQFDVCTPHYTDGKLTSCTGQSEDVAKGDFQCDAPSSGSTCQGSGEAAPCKNTCHCIVITAPDPDDRRCGGNNCQQANAETKSTVDCPQG
jgi:hypothetical protein